MNFIQGLSNYLAKSLANKVPNIKFPSVEDQIEVYNYGFQVIIGALGKGLLLVVLASVLHVLIPALVITLTFSSLRVIAGGYHMQTYNRCISLSLLMFLGSAFIVQNTYQYWTNMNIWSLFVFCITTGSYVLIRYSPKDNPNKPITKQSDIKRLKKWSINYLLFWIIIMFFVLSNNYNVIIISSCFGFLLELFSVSNMGYGVYKKLDSINEK